jgi:peptidoglycan-associated lipoprotein
MRNEAMLRAAMAALCVAVGVGCQSDRGWRVAEDSEWREGGDRESAPLPPATTDSAPGLTTVYFDFDAWSVNAPNRELLRANAKAISANPEWGALTVEGHCDERGSEEYNLVLGKRRADEVVGYLVDLGIPRSRLSSTSFGEARPAVQGDSEDAWRWNRRSMFLRAERTASR